MAAFIFSRNFGADGEIYPVKADGSTIFNDGAFLNEAIENILQYIN
jgi:hypothetical protein